MRELESLHSWNGPDLPAPLNPAWLHRGERKNIGEDKQVLLLDEMFQCC